MLWDSPAFNAGLTHRLGDRRGQRPQVRRRSRSKHAIKAADGDSEPRPSCWSTTAKSIRTVELDWHGGLRYPRLEQTGGGKGTLDALLTPLP